MNTPLEAPDWQEILGILTISWPPSQWSGLGVVVGCSGGADSVALLRALVELRDRVCNTRGFLVVAHFNHGLRGEESDQEEAFVCDLARQFQLRFVTERATEQGSDEATLRNQRLQFLLETAKNFGARFIAVAHTIDDNVETVLHHLMRGTGPSGITGIAPSRSMDDDFVLVRPLLVCRREQLRDGLRQIEQPWREDSSNENTEYRRNWIRHELIPLIESQYPDAVTAISRAIEGQRQWRQTIEQHAARWLSEHLVTLEDVTLSRDAESDPAIVIAALQIVWTQKSWPKQEMARSQWTRLATTLLGRNPERYCLPAAIEVVAQSDHVTIRGPKT